MEQYLIDTNVVSDYFSASFSDAAMMFMDRTFDSIPNLSVITQIELLCWKIDPATEQKVENFISDCCIMNINSSVIAKCVTPRKGKKIKLPDAIIAATALAYEFILVTNNEKDFVNIKDLQIFNPYKI